MNDVDKLTLELFTSKNTYRKYLAKTDPETFQKQERLQEKIDENKVEILERIEEMLDSTNSSTGPSAELTESFERFLSILLQEIESAKLRQRPDSPFLVEDYSEQNREEDDEEMFPVTKMSSSDVLEREPEKKSFWSKDRVIKRETYSEAIVSHYPTNTEIRKRYVGKRSET
jgi:hypothetical protein